jgi:predicted Zn-dependent protease
MPRVFEVLQRVSAAQGEGRIPGWRSTHPSEEERIRTIGGEVARLGGDFSNRIVNRDVYVRNLDRVIFGKNPREGFFMGSTFIQPDLGVQIRFPDGWKTSNERSAVEAVSPNQDALLLMTLSEQSSAQAAAQQFFARQGIQGGETLRTDLNGLPAVARTFVFQGSEVGNLQGIATFAESNHRVFQILGITRSQSWRSYDDALSASLATLGPVTDRRALDVQPKRLEVVSLPSAMTLEELARRYPSTVDLNTLAIINQADAGTRFAAGEEVKRVVGGELPAGADLRR